jgi:hypothetical protein
MKITKLTGVALAAGAASLFAVAPAFADDASTPMVHCKGANACKGKGACKTSENACKGKNGCKGKGMAQMSKEDCEKAGGTVANDD